MRDEEALHKLRTSVHSPGPIRSAWFVKLHLSDERTNRHVRLCVVSVRGVHPMRGTKRDASWKFVTNFLLIPTVKKFAKWIRRTKMCRFVGHLETSTFLIKACSIHAQVSVMWSATPESWRLYVYVTSEQLWIRNRSCILNTCCALCH